MGQANQIYLTRGFFCVGTQQQLLFMPHCKGALGAKAARRRWFSPETAPLSGVLMNGGRLFVPPSEYRDFLAVYATDAAGGNAHPLVEIATVLSKWYADVDLVLKAPLDDKSLQMLAACVSSQLNARVIVLCAPVKVQQDGRVKTGVHLVSPDRAMSLNDVAGMRPQLLARIQKDCPELLPLNGWEDAFDAAPYKNGSLRMAMAPKWEPCRADGCSDACRVCGGVGKIECGRAYTLSMVLDANGARNSTWEHTLRSNPQLLVQKASIRVSSSTSVGGANRRAAGRKRKKAHDEAKDVTAPAARADLGGLVHDADALRPEHRDLRIVDVKPKGDGFMLRVQGSGARHCANVNREHHSSSIWFDISADGELRQRCFCRKGTCPTFRGQACALTTEARKWLGIDHVSGLPSCFAAQ